MVAFGNPVQGHIYRKGEAHPAGTFIITCDFACHRSRVPPKSGIDIGNGSCGAPVLAACSGKISLIVPGKVGSTASADASIFRIKRADGWEFGVAHLKIKAGFAVGQAITEGTQIGTNDKIGATACHVHLGVRDPSGVEVDGWPLLRQNGAQEEEEVLQGANPKRIVNRKTSVKGDNTRFRSAPFVKADNILGEFDTGVAFAPDWSVEGTLVCTSRLWYGGWMTIGTARQFGYMHELVLNPLSPIESSGVSQADYDALLARFNGVKKKVADNAVDVAND